MRNIEVFSTTEQSVQKLIFSGSTFGDLKRALGINSTNLVARGRTTKTKYELDEAILSENDSFFFLSVKKQELGLADYSIEDLRNELMDKVDEVFDEVLDRIKALPKPSGDCNTPDCLDDELNEMIRKEQGR